MLDVLLMYCAAVQHSPDINTHAGIDCAPPWRGLCVTYSALAIHKFMSEQSNIVFYSVSIVMVLYLHITGNVFLCRTTEAELEPLRQNLAELDAGILEQVRTARHLCWLMVIPSLHRHFVSQVLEVYVTYIFLWYAALH